MNGAKCFRVWIEFRAGENSHTEEIICRSPLGDCDRQNFLSIKADRILLGSESRKGWTIPLPEKVSPYTPYTPYITYSEGFIELGYTMVHPSHLNTVRVGLNLGGPSENYGPPKVGMVHPMIVCGVFLWSTHGPPMVHPSKLCH